MGYLDDLLLAPNFGVATSSAVTGSAGGAVSIVLSPVVRKKSGNFFLGSTVTARYSGSAGGGITAQFFSTLAGALGPAAILPMASAAGSAYCAGSPMWIDQSLLAVGQPNQYSLVLTPLRGTDTVSMSAGGCAAIVNEL